MKSKAENVGFQILINFDELFSNLGQLERVFPNPIMLPLRLSESEDLLSLLKENVLGKLS